MRLSNAIYQRNHFGGLPRIDPKLVGFKNSAEVKLLVFANESVILERILRTKTSLGY